MLRALMVAVATMLVAGGVAACSKAPVPVGLAGVGIGPDGQWIGYLQVCSGQVDRAEVYVGEGGEVVTLGIWTAQDPVTGFASWDLESPGEGWTAAQPLTTLADDTEYSMYGGSEGSSTTVGAGRSMPSLARKPWIRWPASPTRSPASRAPTGCTST